MHSVTALTSFVDDLLKRMSYKGFYDSGLGCDLRDVLDGLGALDESGQTFRYSATKSRSGNRLVLRYTPDLPSIDIETFGDALDEAGNLLLFSVNAALDQYMMWLTYADYWESGRRWREDGTFPGFL